MNHREEYNKIYKNIVEDLWKLYDVDVDIIWKEHPMWMWPVDFNWYFILSIDECIVLLEEKPELQEVLDWYDWRVSDNSEWRPNLYNYLKRRE